jgi:hypothetical protein
MADKRPVDRNDYQRLLLLLMAVDFSVLDEDRRQVWEVLDELHDKHKPVTDALEPVEGQDFLHQELHHAQLVIEALNVQGAEVTVFTGDGPPRNCVKDGCPALVKYGYCDEHRHLSKYA